MTEPVTRSATTEGGTRDLTGTVVVVIGATAGIGRATARLLVRHGARVALLGRRQTRLDDLVEELGADRVATVCGDVAEPQANPIGAMDIPGMPPGGMQNLGEMMKGMFARPPQRRRMTVAAARVAMTREEADRLLDTDQLTTLAAHLTSAGLDVQDHGTQLRVHGSDRRTVAQVAHRHDIPVLELTETSRSLEDSLLDLTASSAEFASA